MKESVLLATVVFLMTLGAAGNAALVRGMSQSTTPASSADAKPVMVIQDYANGLTDIRAANPDVHLSVSRDPALPDEQILIVEYPVRTSDPAGRDVRCIATNRNWSAGRAVAFQIRPDRSQRFSLSFQDRNHVAYTTWTELTGAVWQLVRIPFDAMRPNPYFQPPGARTGSPLDVTDIMAIAFAPQDQSSGRLALGKIVVSQ